MMKHLFRTIAFLLAAYLIYKDEERDAEDHFSKLAFAKWMIFENKNRNGGLAFTFGTGGNSTDGSRGPGLEIGLMVFPPPFLCKNCQ